MRCCKWEVGNTVHASCIRVGCLNTMRTLALFSGTEATDHWARQPCGLLKGLAVIREDLGDMLDVKTHESCDTEN